MNIYSFTDSKSVTLICQLPIVFIGWNLYNIILILFVHYMYKMGPFVLQIIYCLIRIETNLACAGLNSAHVECYRLNKPSLYDFCVVEIF